jgi:hypothetical protein
MKRIILLGACLLIAAPALAQSMGEKSGINSALGISPKTTDFVNEAATGDMFEIKSSQLAAERTKVTSSPSPSRWSRITLRRPANLRGWRRSWKCRFRRR